MSLVNFHLEICYDTISDTEKTRYILCRRLKFEQSYQEMWKTAAGVCIGKMKLGTKRKVIGRELLPSGSLRSE